MVFGLQSSLLGFNSSNFISIRITMSSSISLNIILLQDTDKFSRIALTIFFIYNSLDDIEISISDSKSFCLQIRNILN